MLIDIEKTLMILPDKVLLLDHEQKNINLKGIIINTIKHSADIASKKERDIYQRIIQLCSSKNTSEHNEEYIELTHEEISLLEQWVYQSPLKGFVKNSIIALLNGEY